MTGTDCNCCTAQTCVTGSDLCYRVTSDFRLSLLYEAVMWHILNPYYIVLSIFSSGAAYTGIQDAKNGPSLT